MDIWTYITTSHELPSCGWKVHVSATLEEAQEVLSKVSEIAYQHRCSFKFLSGRREFYILHSKTSSRLQSGKFIALYPLSEVAARDLMETLSEELKGFTGLDILTDRAFRDSPNVYYRWGAFGDTGRLNAQGESEELLEDGFGNLVPDVRLPQFVLPEGIVDPFSTNASSPRGDPPPEYIEFDDYRITSVLRYTNAGGRYKALCKKTKVDLVLKEARPNTGFSGKDTAQVRLKREAEILTEINNKLPNLAPQFERYFTVAGHEYLALEFVSGTPLSDWIALESPFYSDALMNKTEVSQYLDKASEIYHKISLDLKSLHAAGYTFGDLSASNIIIADDGEARLIDFEACDFGDFKDNVLGTPDFCLLSQNKIISRIEKDRYALSCLGLSLILRLSSLAEISDNVLCCLETEISEYVDELPDWWVECTSYAREFSGRYSQYKVKGFTQPSLCNLEHVEYLKKQLALGIIGTSKFKGSAGVYPLSSDTPSVNQLSFSMGDSGILWSLNQSNVRISEILIERYAKAVDQCIERASTPPTYAFGLCGMVDACHVLGLHDQRIRLLDLVEERWRTVSDPGLANGLSGVALTLKRHGRAGTGEEVLTAALNQAQEFKWAKNGLFWGRSGVIATACGWQEFASANPQAMEIVSDLITAELGQTLRHSSGNAITLRGEIDGNRFLPYVSDGTAGLLLALMTASQCSAIKYSLSEQQLLNLAQDLCSPFTIDVSLAHGGVGLSLALEILHKRYPALSSKLPSANWARLRKYVLPFTNGFCVINPRTLNYDLSYSKGSAGFISVLNWLEGKAPINLFGLYFPPISE